MKLKKFINFIQKLANYIQKLDENTLILIGKKFMEIDEIKSVVNFK
jgi:hypothetical protein